MQEIRSDSQCLEFAGRIGRARLNGNLRVQNYLKRRCAHWLAPDPGYPLPALEVAPDWEGDRLTILQGLICPLLRISRIPFFLVHASAVALNGRATALVGWSGTGKTTLALAVLQSGGRLISDDCSLIAGDPPRMFPLTRDPVTLRQPALDWLCRHAVGRLGAGEIAFWAPCPVPDRNGDLRVEINPDCWEIRSRPLERIIVLADKGGPFTVFLAQVRSTLPQQAMFDYLKILEPYFSFSPPLALGRPDRRSAAPDQPFFQDIWK